MKVVAILGILLAALIVSCQHQENLEILSPDESISVKLKINDEGRLSYSVYFMEDTVLYESKLGIVRDDADFSSYLSLEMVTETEEIKDSYKLLHGKKKDVISIANKRVFSFRNASEEIFEIIFQVSDDGFAFRYNFPEKSNDIKKINQELTSFNFVSESHCWIQPRAKSKSGWNQVNPSYEEHYWHDILLAEITANDSGWIFPVLVHTPNCWVNITESWPDRNYCGSHLNKGKQTNELVVSFPEATEGFTNGVVYPESTLPWSTPWRIVTMGDLGTIAESTLGTDVATPSVLNDVDYVKPGRSSWSWALMKDPSVNYENQVEFIKYAADMTWEYCLIDVSWDTQIGWEKMKDLARLASSLNVGLIVWYNSSGDWNTVPYNPKDKLLDSKSRTIEFAKLKALGIKGIKVDFFGGDGQSMMAYYQDILEDAHKYQLVVNCHGATLPRGLHRTYPNLVSMESVRGFEYATFGQETADKVPTKSTIIPFTRNAFDPMDFTPVCFNEYDNNERKTGNAAELAQAILFLSGIQHYAETPWGMEKVPEYVKNLMREIPVSWDETKFIAGYPGEYIVIARRSGDTWYVAGINADKSEKNLTLSLPFAQDKSVMLITEDETLRSFFKQEFKLEPNKSVSMILKPNGGFVMKVVQPEMF